MPLSDSEIEQLRHISTATITMVLLKHGFRNVWLRYCFPLASSQKRIVGPAFTMRFLPPREDLSTPESLRSGRSTRAAIEEMPSGAIVVIDAMGVRDAGVFGDILCERMKIRGVAGMVTDGVVRDIEGVRETGFPVWCRGAAAPPSVCGLTFAGWQDPIGCAGVAIYPNDVLVADADGAVLIPPQMVGKVLDAGPEQERLEKWILNEVKRGQVLPGLYPPNDEARARYERDEHNRR